MSIRVLIADDQALVRAGFRMILTAADGMDVVAEAANGAEAVAATRRTSPDVVLMDVRMPELDGIEATRQIAAAVPTAKVLVLTTFDLDEYVFAALRVGAAGFLLKDVPMEDLVAAVRAVAAGASLLSPAVVRRVVEQYAAAAIPAGSPLLDRLTPRELDVLRLLARGLSNAEIAADLVVSEATVKTHVTQVLAKLQLRSRVQAVIFSYEHGIVRAGAG